MTTSTFAWHPYTQSTNDESRIRFNQPAGFAPLKQKYIDSLLHEEVDTSECVHKVCLSIAMSAFASGWAFSFVEKMLLESPALGPNIQKRGTGRLTNILTQAKARANPADISAHVNALRVRLAESRTAIQSVRWPRVDGISVDNSATTKVLLAILNIADAAATAKGLHLASRRVALESGTNKSVANRAIKRLCALDILRPATESSSAQHGHAKGYHVNLDAVNRYSRSSEGAFDHTLIPYLSHDAFRRGALGPTSLRVLATMLPGARLEVFEIAEQVGLSAGWVKVILIDRLAAYRLVGRSGDFWSRCPNAVLAERLDEAALFCGKAGERARLAAVYEQERHHYRYRRHSSDTVLDLETGAIEHTT